MKFVRVDLSLVTLASAAWLIVGELRPLIGHSYGESPCVGLRNRMAP